MAAGRSAEAGTCGGGVDIRRLWDEVTLVGKEATLGCQAVRRQCGQETEASASRGWEGRG